MKYHPLPEINAERCVHSALAIASCSACAAACPQSAIVLDENSLGFDDSACDGCGICVAACPVSAIEFSRGVIAIAGNGDNKTAYLACKRYGHNPGEVSCVNALGIRDLSALHGRGVRHVVAHADCSDCAADTKGALDAIFSQFGLLMASRGLDGLALETAQPARWNELVRTTLEDHKLDNPSRRALFAKFASGAERASDRTFRLASEYDLGMPESNAEGTLYRFVPAIDPASCNGCDACCRICPTGALTLINAGAVGTAYRVEPGKCTGCGLCVDVCDQEALFLHKTEMRVCSEIALELADCTICGAAFHRPVGFATREFTCRICSGQKHPIQLFQVLK